MTYLVHVEPADDQRRDFARWCLAQDPQIMTVSASGFNVPSGLFVDVPEELLRGAYIDGRLYRHVPEEVVAPVDVPQAPVRRSRKARTARQHPASVPEAEGATE